jgi:hypothetical protein
MAGLDPAIQTSRLYRKEWRLDARIIPGLDPGTAHDGARLAMTCGA